MIYAAKRSRFILEIIMIFCSHRTPSFIYAPLKQETILRLGSVNTALLPPPPHGQFPPATDRTGIADVAAPFSASVMARTRLGQPL